MIFEELHFCDHFEISNQHHAIGYSRLHNWWKERVLHHSNGTSRQIPSLTIAIILIQTEGPHLCRGIQSKVKYYHCLFSCSRTTEARCEVETPPSLMLMRCRRMCSHCDSDPIPATGRGVSFTSVPVLLLNARMMRELSNSMYSRPSKYCMLPTFPSGSPLYTRFYSSLISFQLLLY